MNPLSKANFDVVEAVDPDGDTLTFSLSGQDAEPFVVDPETGEIVLLASERAGESTKSFLSTFDGLKKNEKDAGDKLKDLIYDAKRDAKDIKDGGGSGTSSSDQDTQTDNNRDSGSGHKHGNYDKDDWKTFFEGAKASSITQAKWPSTWGRTTRLSLR